jgi:hypothetical protein
MLMVPYCMLQVNLLTVFDMFLHIPDIHTCAGICYHIGLVLYNTSLSGVVFICLSQYLGTCMYVVLAVCGNSIDKLVA